ncbi:MAG: secretin N-terminal domain-containing protein [Kiritimatiellia bacterium]|nr:secretin N-terminal domain-containing protein [Kiritimatiellia bacterium]
MTTKFTIPIGSVLLIISALWFYPMNGDTWAQKLNGAIADGAEPVKSSSSSALSTNAVTLKEGLNRRIALDLRNIDVTDVLKFLAQKGNINIIVSKTVEGRVTLFVKNVTILEALDIIMTANNLAYEIRPGEVLYVMPDVEYKLLHGKNFKDIRQVRKIELTYASPKAVFKALDVMKSDVGEVMVDEDSGTLVLKDTPARLLVLENVLASLDKPDMPTAFALQYAKAADVAAALNARLDAKKTGMVTVDGRNNQVIVNCLPERMKEVEEIIKQMDRETKEVLLEVKILRIVLKDEFDMGVDWRMVLKNLRIPTTTLVGSFALPSVVANPFTMSLGHEGSDYKYMALVQLLQQFGEARNLSSPSIAVINGEQAKIHVGTTEAYVTTTVSSGGTIATTAAQVTFLEVGVMLTVTPIINDLGFITIKVAPEVSAVERYLAYKIAVDVENQVPIVSSTTADTTVKVKDGTTVIIGGLRKDEKIKTINKLPILGDIPVIRWAFRNEVEKTEKTEVVVFITPHIITGDQDVVDGGKKPKDLHLEDQPDYDESGSL